VPAADIAAPDDAVSGDSAADDDDAADDEDEAEESGSAGPLPTGAIVISNTDDDELPVYSTTITGATADPVKDYLKQIGKVPLLNAAEEVELAMRIEAGLFAEEKLSQMTDKEKRTTLGRELDWVAATVSGRRTTCSARTSASSCRSPSGTPVAACSSST